MVRLVPGLIFKTCDKILKLLIELLTTTFYEITIDGSIIYGDTRQHHLSAATRHSYKIVTTHVLPFSHALVLFR